MFAKSETAQRAVNVKVRQELNDIVAKAQEQST